MNCGWCDKPLLGGPRAKYCGKKCRQSAWRLREAKQAMTYNLAPGKFGYYDPPYPGKAWMYKMPEVDHAALIREASVQGYKGWALSTSMEALRDVLPLMPEGSRVCVWTKPQAPPAANAHGICNTCEAVIVAGGRRRAGHVVRDTLITSAARNGGTLIGRKPILFVAWLFDLLDLLPGDELIDAFPGTGIVTRAWRLLSSDCSSDQTELFADQRALEAHRAHGDYVAGCEWCEFDANDGAVEVEPEDEPDRTGT
jgi:hypothetical protein